MQLLRIGQWWSNISTHRLQEAQWWLRRGRGWLQYLHTLAQTPSCWLRWVVLGLAGSASKSAALRREEVPIRGGYTPGSDSTRERKRRGRPAEQIRKSTFSGVSMTSWLSRNTPVGPSNISRKTREETCQCLVPTWKQLLCQMYFLPSRCIQSIIQMVFYFLSSDKHMIYMGRDKFENEELLKWGWPEDLWFHVDNLSSAHVYLRLNPGERFEEVPAKALEECCQLVKENSIEGCKKDTVKIVYTPFLNLKKTPGMDIGQVGFHDEAQRKLVHKVSKDKVVLKLVNKTKKEDFPDLEAQLKEKHQEEKAERVSAYYEGQKALKEEKAKKQEQKEMQSYKGFMKKEDMVSNQMVEAEDDFM